jgi:hypothetical protein
MRVRERKTRRERRLEAEAEARGKALVGMVDSAMIMACADGELTDDEVGVVAGVIDGFFDGQITRREIEELINLSLEAMERDGIEGRLDTLAENLPNEELRGYALAAAAAVALSDVEGDEDEEDETYYDIADALDISKRDADAIWDEVVAEYA